VEAEAAARGLRFVRSDYVTRDERETAFLHEMLHHLYEVGGRNEFDDAPTVHSRFLLQHLSAANCVTHFPSYLTPALRERHARMGRPLAALDVGSGSISRLRWGALQGLLHITGIDPMQDLYDIVVAHHGLDSLPSIRVDRAIRAGGEDLGVHVAPGSFDVAYCCNALDHVERPPDVVAEVGRALRRGAPFALEFATREGSRQGWAQLHQFDLFLDEGAGELMCQWRDGRREPLVPVGAGMRLDRVLVAGDEHTVVVLIRGG
jgi:SAM-dependent methyltransferase